MAQAIDLDSVTKAADPIIKKMSLSYNLTLSGAVIMSALTAGAILLGLIMSFQSRARRDFGYRGALSMFLTGAPHALFLWVAFYGGGDWFNGTILTEFWWLAAFAMSGFFVAENMASKVGYQSDQLNAKGNAAHNPLSGKWKGLPEQSLFHAFITVFFYLSAMFGKWLDTSVIGFGIIALVAALLWLLSLAVLWREVARWREIFPHGETHRTFGWLHVVYGFYLLLTVFVILLWILGPAVAGVGVYGDIAIGYLICSLLFMVLQLATFFIFHFEYKDGKAETGKYSERPARKSAGSAFSMTFGIPNKNV